MVRCPAVLLFCVTGAAACFPQSSILFVGTLTSCNYTHPFVDKTLRMYLCIRHNRHSFTLSVKGKCNVKCGLDSRIKLGLLIQIHCEMPLASLLSVCVWCVAFLKSFFLGSLFCSYDALPFCLSLSPLSCAMCFCSIRG